MPKRQIIEIDEELCTGCGECVTGCPEGALQIIDGKARMVSDLFCDGLGACIGTCPEGAIKIIEREAEPYDEIRVLKNIVEKGPDTIMAHLKHLREHGEDEYLQQALDYLKENEIVPDITGAFEMLKGCPGSGCPGMAMMDFADEKSEKEVDAADVDLKSELRQWPIQLQLINPHAPYFKNADLVIVADCVPFTYPDFHRRFLKGKRLIVFCPKLDKTIDRYVNKLAAIFENQDIRSLTLVHMEVPCCFGVERVVKMAMEKAGKSFMVKDFTISLQGEIV